MVNVLKPFNKDLNIKNCMKDTFTDVDAQNVAALP